MWPVEEPVGGCGVLQRVRRVGRPPVGGEVLAAKVGEHYRDHPAALEAVARLRVVRPDWLAQVAEGRIALGPAAAAMLVNLEVATAPVRQSLPR